MRTILASLLVAAALCSSGSESGPHKDSSLLAIGMPPARPAAQLAVGMGPARPHVQLAVGMSPSRPWAHLA